MSIKIAINGFGRIGRCVTRAFFENNLHNEGFELVAINSPSNVETKTHLLSFDSIHGRFSKSAEVVDGNIVIDGKVVQNISERNIEDIDWKKYGSPIVLECSGVFNSRSASIKHIHSGASRVLISAPAKEDEVKTVVYGVNHDTLLASDDVISVGSCTTNAIAPILHILESDYSIVSGFVTTVHAFTGDQKSVDNAHKDLRRARSSAVSMVPTSTGAAKSIGKVIPSLKGKVDGSAIRVPVANVSIVDIKCTLKDVPSVESLHENIAKYSQNSLKSVLYTENKPLVSVDYVHHPASVTVDTLETKIVGNDVRILGWYDNEWGFSVRMLDVMKHWAAICNSSNNDNKTILDYLVSQGVPQDKVAVSLNGKVVPRGEWETTTYTEYDKIELVSFVGGG